MSRQARILTRRPTPAAPTRRGWAGRAALAVAALALLGVAGYLTVRHARAAAEYRAAERCLEAWDAEPALGHARACLELGGDGGPAHLLAARAARLAGRADDARRHLDEALRLNAPAEQIVLERYLARYRQGDPAAVEAKLLTFVDRDHPDWPYVLEALTERWMFDRQLARALRYLDRWAEARPADREARVRRAWVYERLNEPARAVEDYVRALELDPERDRRDGDKVRRRLAELLLEGHRPADALAHYRKLAERHPADAGVAWGRGRALRLAGESAEARQALDAALAVWPADGRLLSERGWLALMEESPGAAEPFLLRSAELLPHDKEVVYRVERCQHALGKDAEAAQWQERLDAIRADERRMEALMRRVQSDPDDADSRAEAGALFLRNGMTDEGLFWLNAALARDPGCAAAHRALAEHYERTGQPARAQSHRHATAGLPGKAQP